MDYQSFSEEITEMIRPQSYPFGMKLLKKTLPKKPSDRLSMGLKFHFASGQQWQDTGEEFSVQLLMI